MMVNDITARAGKHKRPLRVGRGEASGKGKTCGRGHKGMQSRAGGGARPLTEGGQMPFFRRLPKRGFSNARFRTEYEIVNIGALNERFADGSTVDVATLRKFRLVRGRCPLVRILAKGRLEKKLTVEAHAFSEKARAAIEQAGGQVKLIAQASPAEKAAAKRHSAKRRSSASTETAPAPTESPASES